eukprot:gene18078-18317_t
MASAGLVDPELISVIPQPIDFGTVSLDVLRADLIPVFTEISRVLAPSPQTAVNSEIFEAPGLNGAPPVRILGYRPTEARGLLPAILHIHGGGYVVLDAGSMAPINAAQAAQFHCAIFSVDYRLAPETPHPGPLEDCLAALIWLFENADRLGVDVCRVGVKGESAGGGLAAALALIARDRNGPPLAFQHLIYPMLDDRTGSTEARSEFIGQVGWSRQNNRFGWSALLGQAPGGNDVDPYAAPARAADLSGLPPTFISVGAVDLFVEENMDYAARLCRAGVPVELHVYPGAFHSFDMFSRDADVSRRSRRDSDEALRRALQGLSS